MVKVVVVVDTWLLGRPHKAGVTVDLPEEAAAGYVSAGLVEPADERTRKSGKKR